MFEAPHRQHHPWPLLQRRRHRRPLGQSDAAPCDLRPGAFSSYDGGLNNIAIAYDHFATNAWDAWIEAARAGSASGTLRGNDMENFLYGI
jgi:hypothetical protein